ncbi:MAG: hypothetical protein GX306_10125 [Clostridiales bacterium]|nr:hypothetical protein [Clostridiales bacterium]
MADKEYKLHGYSFTDFDEYREAKQEADSVNYIRVRTDFNDLSKVTKLYHSLIDKCAFKTIIGYAFLKELQDIILKGGISSLDTLPSIRIENIDKPLINSVDPQELKKLNQFQKQAEEYRIRHRNSRIINVFLIIIIVAMIIINLQ